MNAAAHAKNKAITPFNLRTFAFSGPGLRCGASRYPTNKSIRSSYIRNLLDKPSAITSVSRRTVPAMPFGRRQQTAEGLVLFPALGLGRRALPLRLAALQGA